MKFAQMLKRVSLLLVVNILVMLTISLVVGVVLHFLGIDQRFGRSNYSTLFVICFAWGMVGSLISLAMSRLMAKWMMGVQVIPKDTQDPSGRQLVQLVHELAQRAGLPEMPEVGFYDSPEVNAFATGPSRSRSLVAVSSGLLNNMDRDEVRGVIAHEIAHIANGDMVTMALIQGVINAFVMFFARIAAFAISNAMRSRDNDRPSPFMEFMLVQVFQVVFSLLGMIVVNWFSRWREFRADAGGARYGGRENMIGALQALQRLHDGPAAAAAEGNRSFDTLKIAGGQGGFASLFATHPPLEVRIAALKRLPA